MSCVRQPARILILAKAISAIFFGVIVLRLLCESWILFFRMNETLTGILHASERTARRRG